jgi:hypothetical protein
VFLHPDIVGLHLPEAVRLLNEVLLHSPALDTNSDQPTVHCPLVETERDDDGG